MGIPIRKIITERACVGLQKETEITPLPETWTVEPLKSLFSREPSNGLYQPQSNYGRGTLILRIDDFGNEGDIVTTAGNRVNADESDCRHFSLAKNDIVVNRVNSLSHLGKTALIGDVGEPMLFESNMMRFRVDEKRIRPEFVFRVLNSAVCKSQIISLAKRAVAQSSINQGDVGGLEIPVPPLDEQRQIVSVLSAVRRAIERQERLIAVTAELKKALMQRLFIKGTGNEPLKQTEIGAVPESWDVLSIQAAVDSGLLAKPMDGNHGELHPKQSEFVSSGIPFVMASDLVDGTIDFSKCSYLTKERADRLQKGFAKEGDVLISHKATIGVTAMVPPLDHYAMLTPQVTYYRAMDRDRLNNKYLLAYLGSHIFQRRFATVADDGSTRAYIGITKQRDLPLLVPPISQQRQIASVIEAMNAKLQLEKRCRSLLEETFRSLLQQLMTAQIRVRDLDLSALDANVAKPKPEVVESA